MPLPSSGAISLGQIRNEFGNDLRFLRDPYLGAVGPNGSYYWNASYFVDSEAGTIEWSLVVVWAGSIVYSNYATGSTAPLWWTDETVTGNNGRNYHRGTNGPLYSVYEISFRSISDGAPYSMSDYYGRPWLDVYVPSDVHGYPTPFTSTPIPGSGPLSFSNFRNSRNSCIGYNGVGWSNSTSLLQLVALPPGTYWFGFRMIGGGGGGGGRDIDTAGNGGCGQFVEGVVRLPGDISTTIFVYFSGGEGGGGGGSGFYGAAAGGGGQGLGGRVGGSSSNIRPTGGRGGRVGAIGSSGYGGGGGGASELWIGYAGQLYLLCVAGGGGGGGGSGKNYYTLDTASNGGVRQGRNGNQNTTGAVNSILYTGLGGDGQDGSFEDGSHNDCGGCGGAGGGQQWTTVFGDIRVGFGRGAWTSSQYQVEMTGIGGNGGWIYQNNTQFSWDYIRWNNSYLQRVNPASNVYGVGGLGGQSNGAAGQNGTGGMIAFGYSTLGAKHIPNFSFPLSIPPNVTIPRRPSGGSIF